MARPSGLRYRLHSAAGAGQVLDPTGSGGNVFRFRVRRCWSSPFPLPAYAPAEGEEERKLPSHLPLTTLSFFSRPSVYCCSTNAGNVNHTSVP
jgi:hypothetical protein